MKPFLLFLLAAPLALAQPVSWRALDGPIPDLAVSAAVADDGGLFVSSFTEVFRFDPAVEAWVSAVGTFSGSFHDLATGPGGRVWAGTGGVWRSANGGLSWEWFSIRTAPHSGTPVSILSIAVGTDGTVYASGFRSTNEGGSWPEMSITPRAMAFVGTAAYAGTTDGLYRSTSSGASWTRTGLDGLDIEALTASGSAIVAATDEGLWHSEDGTTWTATASLAGVRTLAATADGTVWAAAPDGLYRSTDGTAWPSAPTDFAGQALRDVAANGDVLLAVVEGIPYHSTDGGATWVERTEGFALPNATAALATDDLVAVAADAFGPYASTDGGATWMRWSEGLARSVTTLVADAQAGWGLALANNGVYRAPLTLGAWELAALPDERLYTGLASDSEGRLYVMAARFSFEGELYRSTDGGASWEVVHALTDEEFGAVAAGGGIVMATAGPLFGSPSHLLVSVDGGVTWIERTYPSEATGPFFGDGAGRLYVGAGHRLLRSDDAGATWTLLGPAGPSNNRVRDLLAEPDEGLCLATDRGVFCSADDGASFAPVNDGLPGITPVVALVRDSERYIALSESDGVFVSDGRVVAAAGDPVPAGFTLSEAYPNPFRGTARLALKVAEAEHVRVEVFDVLGRRVASLYDGLLAAEHRLTLDGDGLPSGVYFVRAVGERFAETRRVVLLQ